MDFKKSKDMAQWGLVFLIISAVFFGISATVVMVKGFVVAAVLFVTSWIIMRHFPTGVQWGWFFFALIISAGLYYAVFV